MSAEPRSPAVIKFVPAAVILGGLGWTGVVWLFVDTQPFEAGFRWLFFLAWFLAIAGSSLPAVAFLNRRFPGRIPATQTVIVRQSAWLGLFTATLAWLQIGRLTSFALILLLTTGIAVIEWLFRLREFGRWRP